MKRLTLLLAVGVLTGLRLGAETREFPLSGTGWRKVRVTFEARVNDARCHESNALYCVAENSANLRRYQVAQASSDKSVRFLCGSRGFRPYLTSAEWRTFGRELWAEPQADKVVLTYPSARDGVEVRNIRFTPVRDDNLAVNGDFSLGPYNYSGIKAAYRAGRVEPGRDGHAQFNMAPMGAAHLEPVPVRPETTYRITFVWNNPVEKRMRVNNSFLGADGKPVYEFHWYCAKSQKTGRTPSEPEPEWFTSEQVFTTKPGVVALSVQPYHGIVRSYRIEEVRK